LTFEADPEPFGHIRDENVMAMCQELGVTVNKEYSHTLYDLEKYYDIIESKIKCFRCNILLLMFQNHKS